MKHIPPTEAVVTRPVATGTAVHLPAQGDLVLAVERLEQAVASHPLRPAVRFHGKAVTYRDLSTAIQGRTGVLRRLGVGPGVRLGVLLPDCPAIISYTFAAFAVGAAIVPLDPVAGEDTLLEAVRATGVRMLITCDLGHIYARAQRLIELGAIDRCVVVAYASMLPATAAAKLRLFQSHRLARTATNEGSIITAERELLADVRHEAVAASSPTPRPAVRDDVAMVSLPGQPGFPVIASLSHGALATNLCQVLASIPALNPGGETILAAVPLCHPLSLIMAVHIAAASAAELVIPDDSTALSLVSALNGCIPTVIIATPTALANLVSQHLRASSLSRLRFAVTMGSPAGLRLHAAFAALSVPLLQSYGVGAASAIAAITRATDPRVPLGGHCLPQTRALVRDLADPTRDVPHGERGEVHVSGPQFDGPQNRPATVAFVRTGDLGLIDAEGRIVLVDRVEDLIVAAGYLIYPSRIEEALLDHPGIIQAAVIGIGDGRRGNAPKAFVIAQRGLALTERDLRLHLAARISRIEMPADIDFCTTLPHTSFGLVCKATLRREEARRRG